MANRTVRSRLRARVDAYDDIVDAPIEAGHSVLCLPAILYVPRDVLFCICRRVPGEMEGRTV